MAKSIALVTGGSNGIGLAVCSLFATHPGTHVIMGSRSREKGEKAVAEIKSRSQEASISVVQLDVNSDASIEAAVKELTAEHGKLDTLINNAGICPMELSRDIFREAFETNCTSQAMVTRAFLPLLRKSEAGRLIYVSSGLASLTSRADPKHPAYDQDYTVYRMTKAALNMLALCEAQEYKKYGIRVFPLAPGFVVSDLAGMRAQKVAAGLPGPEKSAQSMLAVHKGDQDHNAAKFVHADGIVGDGSLRDW